MKMTITSTGISAAEGTPEPKFIRGELVKTGKMLLMSSYAIVDKYRHYWITETREQGIEYLLRGHEEWVKESGLEAVGFFKSIKERIKLLLK